MTDTEEAFRAAVAGKSKEELAAELRDGLKLEARRLEWLNTNVIGVVVRYRGGTHLARKATIDALCGAEVLLDATGKPATPSTHERKRICKGCKAAATQLVAKEVPD